MVPIFKVMIMDNQHKKIKGYRDLSQEEIDLMNESKELAEQCRQYISKLDSTSSFDIDKRWLNIGKTDLQKGFMALTRSIAKPDGF